MNNPCISIICNAYNHEKYIKDALDSFIMQQVSVPFEILIHDDASTDNTANIIREYEKKYPSVIKPIYQLENKYQNGIEITPLIQFKRAQGKYIAICEGDDYWTDNKKLQKQYDFMEKYLQYSGCCHAYNMVDRNKKLLQTKEIMNGNGIVPMSCLIGNQLDAPHYATLFLRKDYLKDIGEEFLGKRFNDMILRLYCAAKAPLYYLSQNMSVYRRFTEGSWTVRVGMNQKNIVLGHEESIRFLYKYDDYTNNLYTKEIKECIDWREFEIALANDDFKLARKKNAYNYTSLKRKCYITLGCIFPKIIKKLRTC